MMNGLYEAKVYAENGGNVNLRAKPDKNGALIKKIAVGTTVTVTEECDAEWAAVIVGEKTGYMMRKFLQPIGETDIFVGDGYDADRDERLAIALEKIIEIAQSALYGEAKG